jgi:hypothetical protein
MVPRTELDAANDALRAAQGEIDRLKKLIEGMVARAELDKSQGESSRLAGEVVAVVEVVEALAIGVATTGEGFGVGWIFGWTAACTTGCTAGCTALSAAFCTGC